MKEQPITFPGLAFLGNPTRTEGMVFLGLCRCRAYLPALLQREDVVGMTVPIQDTGGTPRLELSVFEKMGSHIVRGVSDRMALEFPKPKHRTLLILQLVPTVGVSDDLALWVPTAMISAFTSEVVTPEHRGFGGKPHRYQEHRLSVLAAYTPREPYLPSRRSIKAGFNSLFYGSPDGVGGLDGSWMYPEITTEMLEDPRRRAF